MVPGAPAADAPVRLPDGQRGWLLRQLGPGFTLLVAGDRALAASLRTAAEGVVPLKVLAVGDQGDLRDVDGLLAERYDLQPGTTVLLRPDQHVCARWRHADPAVVRAALLRVLMPSPTARPHPGPPPKGEGANPALNDDFYESLVETHKDLSLEESQALNARLVLLLANQVGSLEVLREALATARGSSPSLNHEPGDKP
jgi:3-(3-hydroxy-phenyl)propionate hydroxylase